MSSLDHVTGYLSYYLKAGNRHDLHSPFVYQLNEAVFRHDRILPVHREIESLRRKMLQDDTKIPAEDYGAGSFNNNTAERKLSEIVSHSSKSPRYARLLYRLVKYLQPVSMLELGTAAGVSALYQINGNPSSELITLEGNRALASVAEQYLKGTNVRVIAGKFEDSLPGVLNTRSPFQYVFLDGNHRYEPMMKYFEMILPYLDEEAVIIVDDINWSDEMKLVWSDMKKDQRLQVSVDLFQMGLLFKRSGLSKQDFTIRY